MAEKLPRRLTVGALAIGITDEIEEIKRLQELLRLCQYEFSNPTDQSQLRIELLIDHYVAQVDYHLDELNWRTKKLELDLKKVKQLLVPESRLDDESDDG